MANAKHLKRKSPVEVSRYRRETAKADACLIGRKWSNSCSIATKISYPPTADTPSMQDWTVCRYAGPILSRSSRPFIPSKVMQPEELPRRPSPSRTI